ncbi:hypothetical protein G9A89_013595 [Geosiphon pyriformis]|nr:hypothetical protein G9A89_013595 [Geosiphon pyriformis]
MKTSNKGKQRLKQYSRTTPNTSTLQKTTAKHLQTPEQETSVKLPLSITSFPILLENESNHSESLESEETESEPEEITENKEEMATAYIAKIPEFTGTAGEWFENLEELFENWQAFKDAFLQQFTDNNTSITLRNCFHNIKQETSETVMTYLGRFNKLLRQIRQLETNDYYSDAQILIIHPHASADLATAIRHAKSYKIAMKKANHTKLTNSQKKLKATLQTNNNSNNSNNNHKDINPHNDATKTILDHHPTTNLKIVIIVEFQDTENETVGNYKETNKTEVINVILHYNNFITNLYHQLIIYQDPKIKTQQYQQPLPIQSYQTPFTQQYQVLARRLVQHNQFTPQNQLQKESDFQQTAGVIAAPKSNPSNHTILLAQIAQNANLSDIFPFEFEANKLPFLLSNAAVNEQKTITVMYTEATMEGKPICLILDSGSAGSIITYQLIQQLKQNVDRSAQTVIVTADDMKKTPIGEIDNFSFTIDRITIPVKEMPLTETYMALGLPSNWAEETEQEIFEESRNRKKLDIPYQNHKKNHHTFH